MRDLNPDLMIRSILTTSPRHTDSKYFQENRALFRGSYAVGVRRYLYVRSRFDHKIG